LESQLIRKDLFEVHKPSGQISAKLTKNGSLHQLTPMQFDTINFMCYKSREQMHKKYKGEKGLKKELAKLETEEDQFNFLSNQEFEMDLDELTVFTDAYKGNKSKVVGAIKELKEITVEMGMFKQHDIMVEHSFSLLRRYTKIRNSSKMKYRLEPEIMVGWLFTTKPYSKMYLKVQAQLKYTYTKILYENLKDYQNEGKLSKPLTLWNYILGFDPNTTKAAKSVSTLKRDYLNKAIKDINENTDIFIESIKSEKKDKEVYMTIEFHKQDCDMVKEIEIDEMSDEAIKEQLINRMVEAEAQRRLDNIKAAGRKVDNEKAYLKTLMKDVSREEIEYQLALNEFREEYTDDEFEEYIDLLGKWYTKKEGGLNIIFSYENYILVDIMTGKHITDNPKETVSLLSEFNES
jgi:hypothetical protein